MGLGFKNYSNITITVAMAIAFALTITLTSENPKSPNQYPKPLNPKLTLKATNCQESLDHQTESFNTQLPKTKNTQMEPISEFLGTCLGSCSRCSVPAARCYTLGIKGFKLSGRVSGVSLSFAPWFEGFEGSQGVLS